MLADRALYTKKHSTNQHFQGFDYLLSPHSVPPSKHSPAAGRSSAVAPQVHARRAPRAAREKLAEESWAFNARDAVFARLFPEWVPDRALCGDHGWLCHFTP